MTNPTAVDPLVAAMRDIKFISKDQRNAGQGFNFRGIDDLLNAVGPAFRTHGILTIPDVRDYRLETRQGKNGGTLNHCVLTVAYHFVSPNGSLTAITYGEAMDAGDKAFSKAMSVALRTALIQLFAIPTGEPDPDHDSYELSPPDPEQAEQLRRVALRKQIATAGARQGLTLDETAKRFMEQTGSAIQVADSDTLANYIENIR